MVSKECHGALCNTAIVSILNSGDNKNLEVMHLLRFLVFLKAGFQIIHFSAHICEKDCPGRHSVKEWWWLLYNSLSTGLSKADPIAASPIWFPSSTKPEWTLQHWTNYCCTTCTCICRKEYFLQSSTPMNWQGILQRSSCQQPFTSQWTTTIKKYGSTS